MSSSGKILFQREFSELPPYEGLFTLGAPGLHVRGCLEEPVGDEDRQEWGTYVPGICGAKPGVHAPMVNLPWFAGMELWVAGERLDIGTSRVTDHVRKLLMDEAQLVRSLTWTTRSGARLGVDFRRVIRAGHDRLLVQQLSVSSDRPVEVLVISGIDTDTRTSGFDHLVKRELLEDGEVIGADVETDRGDLVEIRCSVDFLREVREVLEERVEIRDRQIFLHQKFAVEPGKDLLLWKFSAVSTSRDPEDALRADDNLRIAIDDLCATAMDQTRKHWRKRWERCDAEIDGPEDDQLALRSALFHLLRAHPEDPRVPREPAGIEGGEGDPAATQSDPPGSGGAGGSAAALRAIHAAQKGDVEEAYEIWRGMCRIDSTRRRIPVIMSSPAECAEWMVAVFGFGGIAAGTDDETLHLRPCLPRPWARLTLRLIWRDQPLVIEITPATVSLTNNGADAIRAQVCAEDIVLEAGKTRELRR